MIELDKRDIKGIASRRFFSQHKWHFIGSLAGWLIITSITMLTIGNKTGSFYSLPNIIAGVVLFAVAIVGVVLWERAEGKGIKAFIRECENTPTLSYVGEPSKEEKKTPAKIS